MLLWCLLCIVMMMWHIFKGYIICVLKIVFYILGIKLQNINDLKENKNISVVSPKLDCFLLFNIQSLEMRDTTQWSWTSFSLCLFHSESIPSSI